MIVHSSGNVRALRQLLQIIKESSRDSAKVCKQKKAEQERRYSRERASEITVAVNVNRLPALLLIPVYHLSVMPTRGLAPCRRNATLKAPRGLSL